MIVRCDGHTCPLIKTCKRAEKPEASEFPVWDIVRYTIGNGGSRVQCSNYMVRSNVT
jgi:hypothetical protein